MENKAAFKSLEQSVLNPAELPFHACPPPAPLRHACSSASVSRKPPSWKDGQQTALATCDVRKFFHFSTQFPETLAEVRTGSVAASQL